MNLLYVTNTRFPSERAHATQIAHMCQAFSSAGFEVTLATGDRQTGQELSFEKSFGFTPNFAIKKFRFGIFFSRTHKIVFLCNIAFFVTLLALRLSLKKFDLIYCRDEWTGWFLSYFVDTKKIIFESHEAKYNWAVKQLLKKGIKLVVISDGIKEFYLGQGIPLEQIHVAHDAVDDSFFKETESKLAARERLGLSPNDFIALYIGGFDPWKGVETFFAAAEHTSGVVFVAIGGSEVEVTKYRAKYTDVHFLGSHPYAELPNNQQVADVLVIPNTGTNDLSAKYTSPLKLFAHLASGVPIVASDIPSLWAVIDDSLATFFTPDDPKDLSKVIESVTNSYSTALQKAERAQVQAKKYTWNNRVEQIIRFNNFTTK
jgi:glycosyltransferase involved in cell wall biosynthesis